jgi:YHS domain-containing protein
MLRILLPILILLLVSALWRLLEGVVQGMAGRGPTRPAAPSVHMVRDPVCGTYVVPGRAVVLSDGRTQVFFCSATCRDQYRARTA